MIKRCLLVMLLIGFAGAAFSQSKKGFEYLEKKELEKAWIAFVKDTTDENMATVAYFGLAKICEKFARKSMDTIEVGMNFLKTSKHLFFSGDEKIRGVAKQFQITKNSFGFYENRVAAAVEDGLVKNNSDLQPRFKKLFPNYKPITEKLETEAWNRVKTSKSFEDLEKLREEFPDFFKKNETAEVRTLRREIVRKTYDQTNDYQTLTRLAQHHQDYLYDDNITMESNLDRKLWSAFRSNIGVENLEQFLREHPDHWISYDCRAQVCATALKEKSLKTLVNFLEDYPESYLGYSSVSWHIYYTLSKDKKAVSALNDAEKKRFDEVMETCRLDLHLYNSFELPSDRDALISQIKKGAPSWRAYYLLNQAIKNYIRKKEFEQASQLIAMCKPLFPNFEPPCKYFYFSRQEWFSAIENILNASYEELLPRPIVELNTEGNEVLPFVSPDRTKLYFTGEGRPDGLKREDPYEVSFRDSTFGKPELIKGLAGDRNESLLSVTADGQEALVYIDGVIHLSKMTSKGWAKPEQVPEIRKNFPWVGKASLTADGSAMVFEAMRSRAALGQSPDMNIYVALRDADGKWQTPFPLPDNINTRFSERSPYIHVDGETLYYSSNGQLGLGGLDIFKTKRLDDTWQHWETPVNVGKEINTIEDDWGFNFSVTADGRTAFFSQADPYGKRKGELMIAGLPEPVRPKAIAIITIPVNLLQETTIAMRNGGGEILQTITVRPGDRKVTFLAPIEVGKVSIGTEDDDFINPSIEIDLTQPEPVAVTDSLEVKTIDEFMKGTVSFQIPKVRFDRSESVLRPDAMVALNKLYHALEGKERRLLITGHTDDVGAEMLNQKLSDARAQTVKDYLVSQGYPKELISTLGKGSRDPKMKNTTEANRSVNRRVEFKFIN